LLSGRTVAWAAVRVLSRKPAVLQGARLERDANGLMSGGIPELCTFLTGYTKALRKAEAEKVEVLKRANVAYPALPRRQHTRSVRFRAASPA
jgi:hypothetical protein